MRSVAIVIFVAITFISAVSAGAYGGGGGAASISAPPCPKNYLLGCNPVLAAVQCTKKPCGSAAAYSHHMPIYLQAPWNNLFAYQSNVK